MEPKTHSCAKFLPGDGSEAFKLYRAEYPSKGIVLLQTDKAAYGELLLTYPERFNTSALATHFRNCVEAAPQKISFEMVCPLIVVYKRDNLNYESKIFVENVLDGSEELDVTCINMKLSNDGFLYKQFSELVPQPDSDKTNNIQDQRSSFFALLPVAVYQATFQPILIWFKGLLLRVTGKEVQDSELISQVYYSFVEERVNLKIMSKKVGKGINITFGPWPPCRDYDFDMWQ